MTNATLINSDAAFEALNVKTIDNVSPLERAALKATHKYERQQENFKYESAKFAKKAQEMAEAAAAGKHFFMYNTMARYAAALESMHETLQALFVAACTLQQLTGWISE